MSSGQKLKAMRADKQRTANSDSVLGAAFRTAKARQRRGVAAQWAEGKVAGARHTTDDGGGRASALHSVWEMNDLAGFFHHAEQLRKDFTAEKDTRVTQGGVTHIVRDDKMRPFQDPGDATRWYELSRRLPVPVRPAWNHSMRKEEVDANERAAFIEWRRVLASIEEREGVVMTPFERNLEVWRQLWRVVERSNVVMMILDARNPLAFRSKATEDMAARAGKEVVLLLNKAELLTARQRRAWGEYFQKEGVTALFFSAAKEKADLERAEGRDAAAGRVGDEMMAPEGGDDRVADDHAALRDELELDLEHLEDGGDAAAGEGPESPGAGSPRDKGRQRKPRRNQRKLKGGPAPTAMQHAAGAHRGVQPAAGRGAAAAAEAPPAPPTPEEQARTARAERALALGGLPAARRYHAADPSRIYTADELVDYALLHRGSAALSGDPVMIGFIGYPNVGKSSTINVLWQAKKVTVSATPGKTKHFQTLRLEHERRVMLCDCPGLVFPSFASTRDHMVVDGVLPVSQLRDAVTTMQIVASRIPKETFELLYTLDLDRDVDDSPTFAHRVANAYARARGYMTDHNKPNTNRGARDILRDYVDGKLIYVWPPPGHADPDGSDSATDSDSSDPQQRAAAAAHRAAPRGSPREPAAQESDSGEEEEEFEEESEAAASPAAAAAPAPAGRGRAPAAPKAEPLTKADMVQGGGKKKEGEKSKKQKQREAEEAKQRAKQRQDEKLAREREEQQRLRQLEAEERRREEERRAPAPAPAPAPAAKAKPAPKQQQQPQPKPKGKAARAPAAASDDADPDEAPIDFAQLHAGAAKQPAKQKPAAKPPAKPAKPPAPTRDDDDDDDEAAPVDFSSVHKQLQQKSMKDILAEQEQEAARRKRQQQERAAKEARKAEQQRAAAAPAPAQAAKAAPKQGGPAAPWGKVGFQARPTGGMTAGKSAWATGAGSAPSLREIQEQEERAKARSEGKSSAKPKQQPQPKPKKKRKPKSERGGGPDPESEEEESPRAAAAPAAPEPPVRRGPDPELVAWAEAELKPILKKDKDKDPGAIARLLCDINNEQELRSACLEELGMRKGVTSFTDALAERRFPAHAKLEELERAVAAAPAAAQRQQQQQQQQPKQPKAGKGRKGNRNLAADLLGFAAVGGSQFNVGERETIA
eukprot:TRINITY_DN6983_c2_g1_i1.p1 TRINITY_DN6983_c2_g1~~TRINITY_DN6983_c2_g1_i1.p1  ORF type:complete len:1190 (+),score=451.02 TRINITY_DN6983_c2_g1_i1:91-3570(+)